MTWISWFIFIYGCKSQGLAWESDFISYWCQKAIYMAHYQLPYQTNYQKHSQQGIEHDLIWDVKGCWHCTQHLHLLYYKAESFAIFQGYENVVIQLQQWPPPVVIQEFLSGLYKILPTTNTTDEKNLLKFVYFLLLKVPVAS